jgi:hypothetical protein
MLLLLCPALLNFDSSDFLSERKVDQLMLTIVLNLAALIAWLSTILKISLT